MYQDRDNFHTTQPAVTNGEQKKRGEAGNMAARLVLGSSGKRKGWLLISAARIWGSKSARKPTGFPPSLPSALGLFLSMCLSRYLQGSSSHCKSAAELGAGRGAGLSPSGLTDKHSLQSDLCSQDLDVILPPWGSCLLSEPISLMEQEYPRLAFPPFFLSISAQRVGKGWGIQHRAHSATHPDPGGVLATFTKQAQNAEHLWLDG